MSGFFEQLQTFSTRVFQRLQFSEKQSPWQGKLRVGFPTGVVLHFTASSDVERALSWFMRKKWAAKASAHVVVDDGWPDGFRELSEDLPLIHALPALVVQCVPPHHAAWHATWTNPDYYGIEMVNAGEVRKRDGKWMTWPNDWSQEWKSNKVPVEMFGKFWEPYTIEQIAAVIIVMRQLRKRYGLDAFIRSRIIGHEQVAWGKSDPGPLFPLDGVRLAMFEDLDPDVYQWFQEFKEDIYFGKWRCGAILARWKPDVRFTWYDFYAQAQKQLAVGKADGALVKVMLALLGYYVSDVRATVLHDEDRQSVKTFQRMSGITVDGIPGAVTQAKLLLRFEDRGMALV